MFHRLKITSQFLLVGGLLMAFTAAVSGYIVSELTKRNALDAKASDTAVFVSGIAGSIAEELARDLHISSLSRSRLDALLKDHDFSARFPFLEIWLPSGTIAYSNVPTLTGRSFDLPSAAKNAFEGRVVSALSDLMASEHQTRHMTQPYLEIYTPLRAPHSGDVVAVAEIHEVLGPFEDTLVWLKYQTWSIIAAVGVLIMAGLFGVIAKAARQIDNQQERLSQKVVQLQQMLETNQRLRERVRRASEKVSEVNERFLRHLGAELHDGPIQLLGFATLNIERLRRASGTGEAAQLLEDQEQVLKQAQAEIRQISKGLLLPDILDLDLRSLIERVANIHEARTGRSSRLALPNKTPELSAAIKICAFRFVQEGLINTFKHSEDEASIEVAVFHRETLRVTISNRLPKATHPSRIEEGLGLTGMRERVESLGGTVSVHITDGELRLVMELSNVGS